MAYLTWSVLAMIAGLVVGIVAIRWAVPLITLRTRRADPEMQAGSTPLQQLARRTLVAVGLAAVVLFWLVITLAPQGASANAVLRIAGEIALAGILLVYVLGFLVAKDWIRKGKLVVDERDEQVLADAPMAQVFGMLACLTVWVVVLSEVYWDAGQVPVVLLSLVFYSTILVAALTLPIGILLAYSARTR